MIKEFEPLASATLHLALDLDSRSNIGSGRHATLEYALRIAGSIARYATLNGLRIRLSAESKRSLHIPFGSGEFHYRTILDALAIIDADGTVPYAVFLEKLSQQCSSGETIVIFLASPPAQTDAILSAASLLRAKRVHLFAILLDRDSFLLNTNEASLRSKGNGSRERQSKNILFSGLLNLDAHCIQVRNHDDLPRIFNP